MSTNRLVCESRRWFLSVIFGIKTENINLIIHQNCVNCGLTVYETEKRQELYLACQRAREEN